MGNEKIELNILWVMFVLSQWQIGSNTRRRQHNVLTAFSGWCQVVNGCAGNKVTRKDKRNKYTKNTNKNCHLLNHKIPNNGNENSTLTCCKCIVHRLVLAYWLEVCVCLCSCVCVCARLDLYDKLLTDTSVNSLRQCHVTNVLYIID